MFVECRACGKVISASNKTGLCWNDFVASISGKEKAVNWRAKAAQPVIITPEKPRPMVQDVITLVCAAFCIQPKVLIGRSRKRIHVRPRHAAYYLADRFTGRSLSQIGRSMGGRDHSTVAHGINQCGILMERNERYRLVIERIAAKLENHDGKIITPTQLAPVPVSAPAPKPVVWEDDEDEMDYLSRLVAENVRQAA